LLFGGDGGAIGERWRSIACGGGGGGAIFVRWQRRRWRVGTAAAAAACLSVSVAAAAAAAAVAIVASTYSEENKITKEEVMLVLTFLVSL